MLAAPALSAPLRVSADIAGTVRQRGWLLLKGHQFTLAEPLQRAHRELVTAWNDLELDTYLPAGSTYRYRRHAAFRVDTRRDSVELQPPSAYFQDYEHNPLVGGKPRLFSPVRPEYARNEFLQQLVRFNLRQFPWSGEAVWSVNIHMVRIIGTPEQPGQPAPEGIHNDGFEFISFHMMGHENVSGGETIVYDLERNPLERQSFDTPMDSLYAEDARVLHFTTPIQPRSGTRAQRDMLLMSYQRE